MAIKKEEIAINMLKRERRMRRVTTSVSFDPHVLERLKKMAKETNLDVSKVIERLVISVIGEKD